MSVFHPIRDIKLALAVGCKPTGVQAGICPCSLVPSLLPPLQPRSRQLRVDIGEQPV